MLLIFLDTETTGLNPEHHRAIEIAYKIIEDKTRKVLLSYQTKIAVSREVWAAADLNSIFINGFTYEELLEGQSEKGVAAQIITDFTHLHLEERGGIFICQNPSFDRGFFNKIISADMQNQYQWPYHWLDFASMYWTYAKMKGQFLEQESSLSKNSIAKVLGLPEEEEPHRAMNGVDHLIRCYYELMSRIEIGL